jgi:hypothetical protein
MNDEPDIGRLGVPTPETLAELEARVRQRLGGRLLEFRLSIRCERLVLGGRTRSYHAKQLVQQAVMDLTLAPIEANEIEVCDSARSAPTSSGAAIDAFPLGTTPPRSPPDGPSL